MAVLRVYTLPISGNRTPDTKAKLDHPTHMKPENRITDIESTWVEQVTEHIKDFDSEDDVTTHSIARTVDVGPVVGQGISGGDKSPYDADAVVRAHLYRELRGMDSIQSLADHLDENRYEAKILGFHPEDTPKRSVLSRWWNDYFSSDARDGIETAAKAILAHVYDQGIPLDTAAYDSGESTGTSERTKTRRKNEKAEDVLKNVRQWLYGGIDLHRNGSTHYEDADYLDMLTHMGLENTFANDGSSGFRGYIRDSNDEAGADTPTGDSLIYHLKKFEEGELIQLFEELNDRLLQIAEKRGMLDGPVEVAIDENAIPYYGDTDDHHVTNIKPKAGTSYGFKFVTLCIVGDEGKRFTLAALPVTTNDDLREKVPQLIEKAKQYVTISQIYADRGYYDTRLVRALQNTNEYFVIRAQVTARSKELWENRGDKEVNFALGETMERKKKPYAKTTVNRIVAPAMSEDDEHMAFITNRPITQELAEDLVEDYRNRWGIETSYRVTGEFRAKTTSKSYSVRLFYYLFSVLLYNVYILTNAIVKQELDLDLDATPPVTAKKVLRELRRLYRSPP